MPIRNPCATVPAGGSAVSAGGTLKISKVMGELATPSAATPSPQDSARQTDVPYMARIALSGVIGALSYALDIAEGEPPGHAVRSCLIGMRLAAELDLSASERSDLFYALLLKDAGCSANANRMAALFAADDRAAKATSKLVDWTDKRAAFLWSLRTVAPGGGLRRRFEVLRGIRDEGDVTRKFMEARCDRGAEIARMLFLSEDTAAAIRSLDEHWDGRGMPDGLQGQDIPLAARILCLAQTVEVFHAAGGVQAARDMARRRRGRWFDPSLVDAFMRFCDDHDFWAALDAPDVSQWEPADLALVGDDARLDRIAEAFARVIDAKSPFTARHSVNVAQGSRTGSRRSSTSARCSERFCGAPAFCTTSANSRSPTAFSTSPDS